MRYSSHVRRTGFLIVALWALASRAFAADLPVEKAIVTPRPNVSSPITRDHLAKVVVELEVLEISRKCDRLISSLSDLRKAKSINPSLSPTIAPPCFLACMMLLKLGRDRPGDQEGEKVGPNVAMLATGSR